MARQTGTEKTPENKTPGTNGADTDFIDELNNGGRIGEGIEGPGDVREMDHQRAN